MIRSKIERFISEFSDNKFERKNCISKICGMCKLISLTFLLFISCWLPSALKAQPEITASGNLFYVKISNGLNAILMPNPQATNAEVTFSVQAGSMYESDSLTGMTSLLVKLFSDRISLGIKGGKSTLSPQNTVFTGYATTERAVFKFVTTPDNINACLQLIDDSIMEAKIGQGEINSARNFILQQIEDSKHDLHGIFEDKMLKGLYVQDHARLEVLGTPRVIKEFDRNTVLNFYKKYFVPNNAFALITGNISTSAVEDYIQKDFRRVVKSEFNPETITKIVDMRPMAYNTQFIVEDTISAPEFQICWQFPGTNNNFHESYAAFLICSILKDKNNYIQVKAAKMGCNKFDVQYDPNNFDGILRITLQPSKKNLFATYQFVMNELGRIDKMLLNESMIGAGKVQFKREFEELKKTKEYPAQIIKHWTFNNDSYYPDLCDSVMSLSQRRLEMFVSNYFNQSPHITGLRISKADRQALAIDSVFTDLDQNVSKYVFTYHPNVTSLEGGENKMKLQNLLQWLTTNPDINIQVNGFSDEHEFNKATDEDSILQFIDSMPGFHRVTSDIIKHKRNIRPELARAAKIVKYLYEHGIVAERLSGTAMMFKSANKQEEKDNMKCTVTLQKERKSPSLYEYHYGKKQE
jgi:hypothetical protein